MFFFCSSLKKHNWKFGATDIGEEKASLLLHYAGPRKPMRCDHFINGTYCDVKIKILKQPSSWIQLNFKLDDVFSLYMDPLYQNTSFKHPKITVS